METKTPTQLDFRMPAEWEPHQATWISWPHNPETWPGKHEKIFPVWIEMIRALQSGEKIIINVNDSQMQESAEKLLQENGIDLTQIVFHLFPTNDCWMRDCGPIFVKNKNEMALVNSEFNMWGGKYPPWDLDNAIPDKIVEHYGYHQFKTNIVLEGGSLDVNGKGTLLTTEQCLLNPNRNPHLNQQDIEKILQDYLGVTHIIWLGDGIAGDDTDGHVDDLSRFVNESTIVTIIEDNPNDVNYKALQANYQKLTTQKDQDGRPFTIIKLPMPSPVIYDNIRLPASYANFYIGNQAVLVPTFQDPNDQQALAILQEQFPDRNVVGINAIDLVWGFGAFHCITQQVPQSS